MQGIESIPAVDLICWWDFMLQIVLEDKVAVLIPSLFKLFSIKLVEELLGKIMCLWGSLILGSVLIEVWDCFLLWILRALDFPNYIKGCGKRKFRKEFSIWLNS